jgi:hypothetical protein
LNVAGFNETIFYLFDRYIYSHETNFLDIQLAIEVYKFANQWMMEHLTKALEEFLATVEPRMIFPVFDLYKFLNVAHGLEFCRKVLSCLNFTPKN